MEPGDSCRNCIEKAMEIPILRSVSYNLVNLYVSFKSKNKLVYFSVDVVERSVKFAVRGLNNLPIQKSLDLADAVACLVLDEVKQRYPVILEPTDKIITSGTDVVRNSPLAQKAILGLDKVAEFAEAVVTMVPSVSVSNSKKNVFKRKCAEEVVEENEPIDDNVSDDTLISKALNPMRIFYVTLTWPLRYTTSYLQSQRSTLRSLTRNPPNSNDVSVKISSRRVLTPKKRLQKRSIVESLFYIPRYLLFTIGKTTCERLERKMLKYDASSPNVADISTEEKKRKRECMDSNESNSEDDEYDDATDDPSYGFLNRTLNSHSEAADADYEPSLEEETDSFEYHSGSAHEDEELNHCDFREALLSSTVAEETGEDAVETSRA